MPENKEAFTGQDQSKTHRTHAPNAAANLVTSSQTIRDQLRHLSSAISAEVGDRCPISPEEVQRWLQDTIAWLFPERQAAVGCPASEAGITAAGMRVVSDLATIVQRCGELTPFGTLDVVASFLEHLPERRAEMLADARAHYEGDPAASSIREVILSYPGFFALATYRLANLLADLPLFPRMLTETAHRLTGIDIHPRAQISAPCAIDHGTGVVIGETAVLGPRVKLYQGVTLGALAVAKEYAGVKRHPTIENDVVIYANATILGGDTVIGHHSIIGGNAWVTSSVPPHATVYRSHCRQAGE